MDAYRQPATWFLEAEQPILAYDVASDGLVVGGRDTVLRQIQGLALARTGVTEKAREVLAALHDEGNSAEGMHGLEVLSFHTTFEAVLQGRGTSKVFRFRSANLNELPKNMIDQISSLSPKSSETTDNSGKKLMKPPFNV